VHENSGEAAIFFKSANGDSARKIISILDTFYDFESPFYFETSNNENIFKNVHKIIPQRNIDDSQLQNHHIYSMFKFIMYKTLKCNDSNLLHPLCTGFVRHALDVSKQLFLAYCIFLCSKSLYKFLALIIDEFELGGDTELTKVLEDCDFEAENYNVPSFRRQCLQMHDYQIQSDEFFKLPSHVKTRLVDEKETLECFEKFFEIYEGIVGIDTEFLSFLPKKSQICLIQISTKDYSWILDIIELKKCKMIEKCIALLKSFFENSKINKLFFGPKTDLALMGYLDESFQTVLESDSSCALIKDLQSQLIDSANSKKSHTDSDQSMKLSEKIAKIKSPSLSNTVEAVFGKKLCKIETTGAWNVRPLRSTQIEYAHLDAYVLLAINEYFSMIKG